MIRYSFALETSCPQFVCVNTPSCIVYVNPLNHITFYPHAVGPESMKYDVCIICLCVVLPHYRPATASAMTIVCLPIASYTSLSLFFGFCFFSLLSDLNVLRRRNTLWRLANTPNYYETDAARENRSTWTVEGGGNREKKTL